MPGSTETGRPPRLFHCSDTHLGHQQYPRTDETGLNVREQDIAKAFRSIVDAAIAAKPDLFLHAGDLFDGVRPGNRALATAMEGFVRLSQAGIPTIVIAGNHEHPKLRETGSPLRLFTHLPNVHVVFQGQRETVTLHVPGVSVPVRIHAVPQCADSQTLARQILDAPTAAAGASPGIDLLVVHGGVTTLKAFSHHEFNELSIDPGLLRPFDYVALGHFHATQQVAPNAWYCGAPERVSIAESGQEKGYLDVRVAPGQPVQATFHPIAGRTYVDLPVLEARGLDAAQAKQAALDAIARLPAGCVARLRMRDLDSNLRGAFDLRAIQQAASRCTHFDLVLEWDDRGLDARSATDLRGVAQEFDAFAAQQPLDGLPRAALLARARAVLESA